MIVRVDLAATPPSLTLEDPSDCGRFHVGVVGGDDLNDVAAALGGPSIDDDVWVPVDRVRSLATGHVDAEWDGAFLAMLEYAATKGWISADGTAIRAHVEWDAVP
jgi:hypothetical protein